MSRGDGGSSGVGLHDEPGRDATFTRRGPAVTGPVTILRPSVHLPFTKIRESGHL